MKKYTKIKDTLRKLIQFPILRFKQSFCRHNYKVILDNKQYKISVCMKCGKVK